MIQSVVKYFHEQKDIKHKVKLEKIQDYNNDLKNLYFDIYGKYVCEIPLEDLILNDFMPQVGSVDLNPLTKDMPYAHFDAEKFIESNERVIHFRKNISTALRHKNFTYARELTGQSDF